MYSSANLVTIKCANGNLVRDRDVLIEQSELAQEYFSEYPLENTLDWTQINTEPLVIMFCLFDNINRIAPSEIDWNAVERASSYILLKKCYMKKLEANLRCILYDLKKRNYLSLKIPLVQLVNILNSPEIIQEAEYVICDSCTNKFVPSGCFDTSCNRH